MQTGADFEPMFALLNGVEVVAILAIILVLFGGKHLNDFKRGLARGGGRFLRDRIDKMGEEAGRTVGYNYAKPVFEAITHNNNTVEFHDPRELRPIFLKAWKLAKRAAKSMSTHLRAILEKLFAPV